MPRHNTLGSRRRTPRSEPEPVDQPVNFEALACELVRRGLATPSILEHSNDPIKEVNYPRHRFVKRPSGRTKQGDTQE